MSVETLQMSLVHSAMPTSKTCNWWLTDLKYRKRFTMETFLFCSSHRFIWKIFDACWRWYCTSTSDNFEPRDVNMLPNHFFPASRGNTLRITPAVVVNVRQHPENHSSCGRKRLGMLRFICNDQCFVRVQSKPTRSKSLTSASKRSPASTRDRPKTKMSSAKRTSSKMGPPSIKLKPTFPTSALRSRIGHCNTEQNKRGFSARPCRVAPPMSPTTSPHCLKYTHCKIHTRVRVRVRACWPEASPFRAQAKAI